MRLIIGKEDPYKIGELVNHAFEYFCLPRGVLRELEWCIYQVPGFERARWDEVLYSNYVPEDLRPIVVEGAVPVSARVCDSDPRKTCLAELGGVEKESECRGSSGRVN